MFAFTENFDFILTKKAPDKNYWKQRKKAHNVIKNWQKVVWQKKRKVKLVKKVGKNFSQQKNITHLAII